MALQIQKPLRTAPGWNNGKLLFIHCLPDKPTDQEQNNEHSENRQNVMHENPSVETYNEIKANGIDRYGFSNLSLGQRLLEHLVLRNQCFEQLFLTHCWR